MASTINATPTSSGLIQTADNTGVLALQTSGTTAVTIDGSQNVGIGTSSPAYRFHVAGNTLIQDTLYLQRASISLNLPVLTYWNGSGSPLTGTKGDIVAIGNAGGDGLALVNGNVRQAGIDSSNNFQFNSGYGSVATAYGCRAWVNFNGTGTVAIRASGNVSSITDNGTGDYTVNFTTAMPDTNYAMSGSGDENADAPYVWLFSKTTSGVRVRSGRYGVNLGDPLQMSVTIFR